MNGSVNDDSLDRLVQGLLQKAIARPEEVTRLPLRELDLLLRVARRVRLLGWLAARLDSAGLLAALPDAASEQLISALTIAEARERLARWELNRIARALEDCAPLQVIALKGCAYLLRGLPNAMGRAFADVDLMVAERHLSVVENALQRHGWRAQVLSPYDERFYRAWSHELPAMVHAEREVEVDVHHNIRGRYAPFKPQAALMLAAARPIGGTAFQSLSDHDLVLHAMTHLMFGGDLADDLRGLVDIDILLRHFAGQDDAFWDGLADRARELELDLPAYLSLRYCEQLLGTPVPEAVKVAMASSGPSAPTGWLLDRLVPKALFPRHPDRRDRGADVARWLLYVRSHWVSMPPLMLMRHLAYKFYVRQVRWRFRARGRFGRVE